MFKIDRRPPKENVLWYKLQALCFSLLFSGLLELQSFRRPPGESDSGLPATVKLILGFGSWDSGSSFDFLRAFRIPENSVFNDCISRRCSSKFTAYI